MCTAALFCTALTFISLRPEHTGLPCSQDVPTCGDTCDKVGSGWLASASFSPSARTLSLTHPFPPPSRSTVACTSAAGAVTLATVGSATKWSTKNASAARRKSRPSVASPSSATSAATARARAVATRVAESAAMATAHRAPRCAAACAPHPRSRAIAGRPVPSSPFFPPPGLRPTPQLQKSQVRQSVPRRAMLLLYHQYGGRLSLRQDDHVRAVRARAPHAAAPLPRALPQAAVLPPRVASAAHVPRRQLSQVCVVGVWSGAGRKVGVDSLGESDLLRALVPCFVRHRQNVLLRKAALRSQMPGHLPRQAAHCAWPAQQGMRLNGKYAHLHGLTCSAACARCARFPSPRRRGRSSRKASRCRSRSSSSPRPALPARYPSLARVWVPTALLSCHATSVIGTKEATSATGYVCGVGKGCRLGSGRRNFDNVAPPCDRV